MLPSSLIFSNSGNHGGSGARGDYMMVGAEPECATCYSAREDSAVMGYAGAGHGNYVKETVYRFVGDGHGEYQIVKLEKEGRLKWMIAIGCALILVGFLVIAAAWWFFVFTTTTTSTSTSMGVPLLHHVEAVPLFDCDLDGRESLDIEFWSQGRRDFCCSTAKVGCPTSTSTLTSTSTSTTTLPFDCSAGLKNWEMGWSEPKKNYCCKHEKKGCPPKCLTESCDATCYHDVDSKGHGHVTCRERTLWAKDNSPNIKEKTLEAAIKLVNEECHCQCACANDDFGKGSGKVGTCLIWGDPHITGFDGKQSNYYGQGEVWMVRTSQVYVQVRYHATPSTDGLAATQAVAVGGPFLNGHIFKVGPLKDGHIEWDGEQILEKFGDFDPDGLGKIIYDDKGQLVDAAQESLPRRIVHVNLPGNFFMQIFRWDNHINVRIRMPPAPDQDGHCGNFNGNSSDDGHDAVVARLGVGIDSKDLLFDHAVEYIAGKRLTLEDCPEKKRARAEKVCRDASDRLAESISNWGRKDIDSDLMQGCIFDVCFAGDKYALQDQVEGW
eukprot:CAMPEP_0206454914 /NCGR_PEP_ID=MMETSP0324_2-20121206/21428_1 /ASSEMBLY_ACC=CAM_ASM_000836 /TAXON_ID=2866 /ORGANISM="Crypthecodinium cohnii, Strain Seligo" /LENGTH=550 /DNA_ID=CAMNT_0053925493 /DNA_START=157 /DNA_END=1809 /DNA_ORIENTATION=+